MEQEDPPSIDSIIAQTNSLSCSTPLIKLEANPSKTKILSSHALVGKVVADTALDLVTTNDKIAQSWKLLHGIQIDLIAQNIFIFKFGSAAECRRISVQALWSVLGHHIILRGWDPAVLESEIDFSYTFFWVQVHGLPLDHLTTKNAEQIGKLFTELLETDLAGDEAMPSRSYMRLKVKVLVSEPLKNGVNMESNNSGKRWLQFKYERHSDFCYESVFYSINLTVS